MKLEKSYNTKQYFHSFYRQNHALLVLSFLFTVICFPANLIGSWLLGQVIDAITEVSMNRLRTIILVSIIFIVTMFFFTILLYWVKSNFIRKALIQYKNLAFEKISEKNIAAFSRENTGSYISMLTNDAASIEENYLRKSFLILHYVLLFFGTLIMMLRYSIVLTFATIVLGFLPAIASILMGKELSSREKIVSDKNETFVTQLKNLLAGFSVIKSFQAEKETQELFNTTNAKIEESKCKRYWWECLLSAVSQNLCGNLMQFGIFLFGASLAIHGDITAGTVLIFFNLCNFIIMPVNIVPQYLASRRAARGLIEKLSQMTVDNAEHDGKDIDIVLPNHIVFDDEQVQQLLAFVHGNVLETVVLLAVLFGLRLSEALGLRWRDVDLTHRQITLRGQIPCDLPKDAKIVPHLEPLKDRDEGETRSFPITEEALPIFLRLRQEQADQRRLCKLGGVKYYDNDLVVCKPDGSPYLQKRISVKFNGFMRSTGMPKIRFHDLRGTAGTNMYNLTGDFYAVSQILGHSVDDFSQQMGVNLKINTVTTRYVQVQEQRKLSVLTAYHQAVFATPKNAAVGDNSL